ncbi:MAG: hypothetical protein KBT05_01905, partial [Bacteroidales bacterium]|nr:hypothetical protein [Candidatus Cryptobacteroides caccocaballi]
FLFFFGGGCCSCLISLGGLVVLLCVGPLVIVGLGFGCTKDLGGIGGVGGGRTKDLGGIGGVPCSRDIDSIGGANGARDIIDDGKLDTSVIEPSCRALIHEAGVTCIRLNKNNPTLCRLNTNSTSACTRLIGRVVTSTDSGDCAENSDNSEDGVCSPLRKKRISPIRKKIIKK